MVRLAFLHRSVTLYRGIRPISALTALRPPHLPCSPLPLCRRPHTSSAAPPPDHSTIPPSDFSLISSSPLATTALLTDTIFALATAPAAAAGVAIIRLSGPSSPAALNAMLRPPDRLPQPRVAGLRALHDPVTGELLDRALVLYFAAPASFTGEHVVELHIHGSRAVVSAVCDALQSLPSQLKVRPASRGEFSRRAFENGRVDLTEAEGLADLIAAETPAQRRQALRHLSGEARTILEGWRTEIKHCLAHVEAVIDFAEDVDDEVLVEVTPRITALRDAIVARLADDRRGEIVRDGASVVIVGPPNAGKSTLLNALARRPAAIVSPIAGTTRDVVEVRMDIAGWPVVVSDTAGLREATNDPVEQEGMRRARRVARAADVVVLMHDASEGGAEVMTDMVNERLQILREGASNGMDTNETDVDDDDRRTSVMCVVNKMDLVDEAKVETSGEVDEIAVVWTSLARDNGVDVVVTQLEHELRQRLDSSGMTGGDGGSAPLVTRARHRHHLREAVRSLTSFLEGRTGEMSVLKPLDLSAEDLRIATKEVGAITGVIQTEEVLDVIFSEFCIGK